MDIENILNNQIDKIEEKIKHKTAEDLDKASAVLCLLLDNFEQQLPSKISKRIFTLLRLIESTKQEQ